jgi:hypothetical protein
VNSQFLARALTAVLVPLFLGWLMRRSAQQSAEQVGGALIFRGSSSTKVMLWSTIVGFSIAAVATLFVARSGDWWLTPLFLGFVMLGAFGFPPVLTVAEGSVSSAAWYRSVSLPWGEVVRLEYTPGNRTFVVVGASGRKIHCTGYHAGSAAFRVEVLRRTGLPLVVKTPGLVRANSTEVPNQVALSQSQD